MEPRIRSREQLAQFLADNEGVDVDRLVPRSSPRVNARGSSPARTV